MAPPALQLLNSPSFVVKNWKHPEDNKCYWIQTAARRPQTLASRRRAPPVVTSSLAPPGTEMGQVALEGKEAAEAASRKPLVKGKTVVITGGSQGSGKETARLFASKGYNVVVVAREPARLQAVADDVAAIRGQKETSLAFAADVGDRAAIEELARRVQGQFESVDIIVNNAGVCANGSFLETPLEVWDSQMSVNVMGAVHVTRALLPDIVKSKGSIIVVNSFGGLPLKRMVAYTASKFALAGFAEALALEMADVGVHVAQVQPGLINSDFLERAIFTGGDADKTRSWMEENLSGPMAVQPSDVAAAVWEAIERKKKEVIVGFSLSAAIGLYRKTGVNIFAS